MGSLPAHPEVRLPLGSRALEGALESGVVEHDGEMWRAVPKAIVSAEGREQVVLSLLGPHEGRSSLGMWWRALRPFSVTATLTPCLAVLALGFTMGWELRPLEAVSALLGAMLLQLAANTDNDLEDHRRLIDLPGTFGGAGVLQSGALTPAQVRRMSAACLVVGIAAGIPSLAREPVALTLVGAAAVFGALGYSGRPLGLKYRALGDLSVFLLCGPLLSVGFAVAAFGRFDGLTLLLGCALGAAATGILHTNNLQDLEVDRARGARTVATVLGVEGSKRYLYAVYAMGYAAWIGALMLRPTLWPSGVLLLFTLVPLRSLLLSVRDAPDLAAPALASLRVRAAMLHLAMGGALTAGLVVAFLGSRFS